MDTVLAKKVLEANQRMEGATIFGYHVADARSYGVVEICDKGRAISLEEKPSTPKSPYAVPGIYFYDERASEYANALQPSPRGELEITDLNKVYMNKDSLFVEVLGRGTAWLDTGTHESLLDAARFVEVIEKRQGLQIGCIEEIAYSNNWITKDNLKDIISSLGSSDYKTYLNTIYRLRFNIILHIFLKYCSFRIPKLPRMLNTFVTQFSLSNSNPESVISKLNSIRQQMRVSTDIDLTGHMN